MKTLLFKRSGNDILSDGFEFSIIPVANPDGYEYSWAKPENRLWRKNRRRNPNGCAGVDLNRNFPIGWKSVPNEDAKLRNPCDVAYPGLYPLSEPESRTVARLMETGGFLAYLSVHSYSRLILIPYSYKSVEIANLAEMNELLESMKKRMEQAGMGTGGMVGRYPHRELLTDPSS